MNSNSKDINVFSFAIAAIAFFVNIFFSGCSTTNQSYDYYKQDVISQTQRLLNMSFDSCANSPYSFKYKKIYCERLNRFTSLKNYDYFKIDSIFTNEDIKKKKNKTQASEEEQDTQKKKHLKPQKIYLIVRWYKNNLPSKERLNFVFHFDEVVKYYVLNNIQTKERFEEPVALHNEDDW